MSKITFVLPIIRKDAILAKTCVFSILSLFNNDDIDCFYIITSLQDLNYFSDLFQDNKYIKIINEDDVYPNKISCSGWQLQQVLKLYISRFISTEYYLILDSDCYLTKKINYSDLFVNNKPIPNLTYKRNNSWLIKSCQYYDLDYEKVPDIIINVTPQLMNTKIVIELCDSNKNIPELIINGCNEFWLYFCFILKYYNFYEIYHVDLSKSLCNKCVWDFDYIVFVSTNNKIDEQSIKKIIDIQFDDPLTIFTLFQSNMHLNTYYYIELINDNIKLKMLD
jgi:hypothetical protein